MAEQGGVGVHHTLGRRGRTRRVDDRQRIRSVDVGFDCASSSASSTEDERERGSQRGTSEDRNERESRDDRVLSGVASISTWRSSGTESADAGKPFAEVVAAVRRCRQAGS